jgi:hypothetical protein
METSGIRRGFAPRLHTLSLCAEFGKTWSFIVRLMYYSVIHVSARSSFFFHVFRLSHLFRTYLNAVCTSVLSYFCSESDPGETSNCHLWLDGIDLRLKNSCGKTVQSIRMMVCMRAAGSSFVTPLFNVFGEFRCVSVSLEDWRQL